MNRLIAFGILTILITLFSWRSLSDIKSHGFYRFFSWECIAWLLVTNIKHWFIDPFSPAQILSWVLLILSSYMVIAGVLQIKKRGKPGVNRDDKTLYQFEKTSELVDTGIYRYIRHPMYGSLILLTWSILLKDISGILILIASLSTFFLIITSIHDERECISFFGEKYRDYMKRTKRFVPFVV